MGQTWESFKVKGDDLLGRVKEILHEGNVRRVVIKQGTRTIVEFPVTVGVVGALAAPSLAAIGALAALLTPVLPDDTSQHRSHKKKAPTSARTPHIQTRRASRARGDH